MKSLFFNLSRILFITIFFVQPTHAEMNFESATTFKASEILPPELVKGPHHKVDEKVINDAYLNIYTIHSEFGDVQAVSTAKLRKYIHEINAVAKMKEIEGSEEFAQGMKEKAGAVVDGAANLVSDPVGSVSNTLSGVSKLFSRAGENMFGGGRSETEGSRMEDLLGYSKAKRDIGYKFGIDVYSHNRILQDQLDALAGAGGTGTLVMSGLLMAVPGGAGHRGAPLSREGRDRLPGREERELRDLGEPGAGGAQERGHVRRACQRLLQGGDTGPGPSRCQGWAGQQLRLLQGQEGLRRGRGCKPGRDRSCTPARDSACTFSV